MSNHKNESHAQTKLNAIINIGIEMDIFEEHLLNENGFDIYTTTAQAIRKALEAAYDAGSKASKASLEEA